MFRNISPDSVRSGRTCPANLDVRSCPVRKLICPVRSSPTFLAHSRRSVLILKALLVHFSLALRIRTFPSVCFFNKRNILHQVMSAIKPFYVRSEMMCLNIKVFETLTRKYEFSSIRKEKFQVLKLYITP